MPIIHDRIEAFEEAASRVLRYVSSRGPAAGSEAGENTIDLLIGEGCDDAEFERDLGIFGEEMYFHKIRRGIGFCLSHLRAGQFEEIEGVLDHMSTYLAQIGTGDQRFIDLDKFRRIADDIVHEAAQIDCYVEPEVLQTEAISEVDEKLMTYVSENPDALRVLDDRLFEEVIAEIFRRFGFDVSLTKRTRDGGYDIIAIESKRYLKNKFFDRV